jgi:hypothetical protein
MENIWFASALWIGLALVAAMMQNWIDCGSLWADQPHH